MAPGRKHRKHNSPIEIDWDVGVVVVEDAGSEQKQKRESRVGTKAHLVARERER